MVNELYERLLLWKEFRLPNIIEREIKYLKQRILLQLWSQKIWYIYFIFQIMKNLIENGKSKENISYVNFYDIIFRKYDVKKIIDVYFD